MAKHSLRNRKIDFKFGGSFLLVVLLISSCATPKLTRQPVLDAPEFYSFNINGIKFSFDIPSGGNIGRFNKFSINTAALESEFEFLFSVGYDGLRTSTRWYDVSHLLFGVIRNPACGFDCIAQNYADEHGLQSRIRIVDADADGAINGSYFAADGDYVEHYYMRLDERFSLFFVLRIYDEHSDYPGLVDSRQAMLSKIVSSLQASSP